MSPKFFASQPCRDEVKRFQLHEKRLGGRKRILPLYYIKAKELENPILRESDEVASLLYKRQFRNWRSLRHVDMETPEVREKIGELAGDICQIIQAEQDAQDPLIDDAPTGFGTWEELAYQLQIAQFVGTSRHHLAGSAAGVLEQLRLTRPPHHAATEQTQRLLRDLDTTLKAGIRDGASAALTTRSCARAEQLRVWLLDVLPDPWH